MTSFKVENEGLVSRMSKEITSDESRQIFHKINQSLEIEMFTKVLEVFIEKINQQFGNEVSRCYKSNQEFTLYIGKHTYHYFIKNIDDSYSQFLKDKVDINEITREILKVYQAKKEEIYNFVSTFEKEVHHEFTTHPYYHHITAVQPLLSVHSFNHNFIYFDMDLKIVFFDKDKEDWSLNNPIKLAIKLNRVNNQFIVGKTGNGLGEDDFHFLDYCGDLSDFPSYNYISEIKELLVENQKTHLKRILDLIARKYSKK